MLDNNPLPSKIAAVCTGHEYEETLDALLQLSLELLQMTAADTSRNQLILIHTAIISSAAKDSDALAAQFDFILHRISDIADVDDRDAVILRCIRSLVPLASVFGRAEGDDAKKNAASQLKKTEFAFWGPTSVRRSAMLTSLTASQIDFLSSSNKHSPLDIQPSLSKKGNVCIEPIQACQAEDKKRAAALRDQERSLLRAMPEANPQEVAALLDHNADDQRITPFRSSTASAVYMRSRRIGVLGAVIDLVRQHPQLQYAWLTASAPMLDFTPNEWASDAPRQAHRHLEYELETSGALKVPGFIVAFINGYFDLSSKRYGMQYRGIIAGEKLRRLHELTRVARPSSGDSMLISMHRISDLKAEIFCVLPSAIRERVPTPSNNVEWRRMRDPFYSFYVLWLAQNTLADLTIVHGAFYWNGGLKLRECYGELQSEPRTPQPYHAADDQHLPNGRESRTRQHPSRKSTPEHGEGAKSVQV